MRQRARPLRAARRGRSASAWWHWQTCSGGFGVGVAARRAPKQAGKRAGGLGGGVRAVLVVEAGPASRWARVQS
jgi:hypothetical protein